MCCFVTFKPYLFKFVKLTDLILVICIRALALSLSFGLRWALFVFSMITLLSLIWALFVYSWSIIFLNLWLVKRTMFAQLRLLLSVWLLFLILIFSMFSIFTILFIIFMTVQFFLWFILFLLPILISWCFGTIFLQTLFLLGFEPFLGLIIFDIMLIPLVRVFWKRFRLKSFLFFH